MRRTSLTDRHNPAASGRVTEAAYCLSVFIEAADRFADRPLYTEIVERARLAGLGGVTVSRGMRGFGASGRRPKLGPLRSGYSVPVLIEVVAPEARVQAFLPVLDEMIGSGLMTLRPVTVSRSANIEIDAPA